MAKVKFPFWSIVLFCFILIVLFVSVMAGLIPTKDVHESKLIFLGSIFSWILIIVLFFFRRIILSFNAEIETRTKLQDLHLKQIQRTYAGTLQALTKALDFRDHATWGHSARVVGYAIAIGEKMGLSKEELNRLAWGGFLHDIGKIGVSDSVLLKNSELTRDEWEAIQLHPGLGFDIVNGIEFLEGAAEIILAHHERYDGNGYPRRLHGEVIPLPARIFAVADALDAITSDRPYRSARSIEAAFNEIQAQSSKHFCPECVKALTEVGIDRIRQIQEQINSEGEKHGFSQEMMLYPGLNPVSNSKA